MEKAKNMYEETGEKQRLFTEFSYAAKTWSRERRIIGKAEHSTHGNNQRFIVTNLDDDNAQRLYDEMYCSRGEMENRIKEQQLGLFSDKTSCHNWWPNQLRVLFSALAYILIEHIRGTALSGTQLARAQISTIRLKLFKIGAVVFRNTRHIRFSMSSFYPLKDLFVHVWKKLVPT